MLLLHKQVGRDAENLFSTRCFGPDPPESECLRWNTSKAWWLNLSQHIYPLSFPFADWASFHKPGKTWNYKFEVWFLLSTVCFCIIIRLKNQGWRGGSAGKSTSHFAEDRTSFSSTHIELLTTLCVSKSRVSESSTYTDTLTHMHTYT